MLEEDLNLNPEDNPNQFVAILVKSLCLLEKLPFVINVSLFLRFVLIHIF